jgi:AraC-type DNA-binding domain-containing proteins
VVGYMYGVILDRPNIEKLLKDFYTFTQIRIAFYNYDCNESAVIPKDICEFCTILKKDKDASNQCRNCDRMAFEAAANTKSLYLYECHAGLTEAVSPIIIDDKLTGYLMFGQTLRNPPTGELWNKIYDKCKKYKIDLHDLENAFYKLHYLEWNRVKAAAGIMDMSAKYICLTKMAKVKYPNQEEVIRKFIDDNIEKTVTISDISKNFCMSKSYLSFKIKAMLGDSLNHYIHKRKIEIAKYKLEQTNLKINEIAETIGFNDVNYFSRTFKKVTGHPPTEYRTLYNKK